MPTIFYQIFNHQIKITEKILKQLWIEIEALFVELKKKQDLDNIKILRNKLIHLLDERNQKADKKIKKAYKNIKNFLDEIEDFIEDNKEEKIELIDVVKKIDEKYKKFEKIKKEKIDKYKTTCRKKKTINYEKELIQLQVELLKLQKHVKETWEKVVILFEWRDAAWKWWTIKRFREYLNPRWAEVVALEKPTEKEKTEWYFQRYVKHLPSAWEIKFFDRSWYNRAWVEPVMWFTSKRSYERFLKDAPNFEKMLIESWIKLIKFYFSVSKNEQAKRFNERKTNPLKQFKLSPIDQFSQQLWEKYSLAEYRNFKATHKKETPWTLIKSDNKKKARVNAIKFVLNKFKYPWKLENKHFEIDPEIVYDWKEKVRRLSEEINTKQDLFD